MVTKEQIQDLRSQTDRLQKKLDEKLESAPTHLSSGAPLTIQKYGLRLKEDTDLFTDEEKAFFRDVDSVCEIAMRYISDLADSVKKIQLERQTEQAYIGIIVPPEMALGGIEGEIISLYQEVQDLFNQLYRMQGLATSTGWARYITEYLTDYVLIMEEATDIVRGIDLIHFIEHKDMQIEMPRTLRVQVDAPYFYAGGFRNLSTTASDSEVLDFIEMHTYYHKLAIEELGYSTVELEELIERKMQILEISTPSVLEEEIPRISTLVSKADNYYWPVDKFSRSLPDFQVGYDEEGREIINEVKLESEREHKNGLQITGKVSFTYRDQDGTTASFEAGNGFTYFDTLVMGAVYTAWENARIKDEIKEGEALITLRQLYQYVVKEENVNPTPEALEELKASLMKFATTYTKLDVSEEAEHHKKMGDFKRREGAFCPIVIDTRMVHGKLSDVVHIIRADNTPFLSYNKVTGRIGSAPYKKLSTPNLSKNEETALIKHYLVDRICSKSMKSDAIVFDTIFVNCGIRKSDYKNWKVKRAKLIKKVLTILEDFKKNDLIKDYKVNRKGHMPYYSVSIIKKKVDNAKN